ncbi:hypothetical protein QYE76_056941 [Lolium multiflorum]|uniref:Uncharacterized protein n=1 Tax=Lolium multiflorum TaxID=4521 RepID=A0AAD8WNB9_LOLMU|nr:hypothetical protein QYE76_056941 [Lolium multiflorum]
MRILDWEANMDLIAPQTSAAVSIPITEMRISGFMPSYNCWTKHGERGVMMEDNEEEEEDDDMYPNYGDTATGHDEDEDAGGGDQDEEASDEPVDDDLHGNTKLGATLELLQWKAEAGICDKPFEKLLKIMKRRFPKDNELPDSTYEAKKVLCPLGLDVKKIHAYINDYILYCGEYENLEACRYAALRKRTPDEAEELLAKISKNHDDWSTPEPTPTPILKKRGMIELNDEDMREAKKSLMEKGIKSEDVKNLPPIEDLCKIIPPSSTIEDPLYPEGHPKRIEQDSQRTKEISSPSKKKKKKHKTVVESSEPVNDPNSISISDAETESGNEHDEDNDKNDTPDKEEIEKEPEKHAKNKKYTKEDFITKKHAIRVPQWGSCEKVRGTPRELSNLYTMICQGRSFSDDGGKISSIQLPAIRYFAYFVTKKGWSVTENELNAYIEREGHHARDGTEEAEEHLDSSSDAASSSYQHYGHVEPPRHSSAQGPYYHSMYDPPAWNPDPRWE